MRSTGTESIGSTGEGQARLEEMDCSLRLLEGEVVVLAERLRHGDASAYRTLKFRKRALRDLTRRLKELQKKEQRRLLP